MSVSSAGFVAKVVVIDNEINTDRSVLELSFQVKKMQKNLTLERQDQKKMMMRKIGGRISRGSILVGLGEYKFQTETLGFLNTGSNHLQGVENSNHN